MNDEFNHNKFEWPVRKMLLILLVSVLFLDSCRRKGGLPVIPEQVQSRAETIKEEVDAYFREHPDSLKQKAARFLLDNSRYHLHQTGKRVRAYSELILSLPLNSGIQEDTLRKIQDQFSDGGDSLVYDIFTLDGPKMIDHVNLVVDFYRKAAWGHHVPFSVFCDYLLPYNTGQDGVGPWTCYFRDIYFAEQDSSLLTKKIEEAVSLVHQWIYQRTLGFQVKWGQNALNLPELSPVVLDHLRIGSCQQLTARSTAMMRALGIPVAMDMIPYYLNRDTGHSWNAAVLDSARSIPLDATSKETGIYRYNSYKISKVYRQAFSVQDAGHPASRGLSPYLPEFLRSPFYRDVTDQYTTTSDVVIPVGRKEARNGAGVCLSLFNRAGWKPVSGGTLKHGVVYFRNVGRDGVYLPVRIDDNGTRYFRPPFILNNSGTIHYLKPDTVRRQALKLIRKFPLDSLKKHYIKRMIGGIFQGANRPDFRDAVVLYQIKENPGEQYGTARVASEKKFRYVRYLSPPASHGNIAELEFYGDTSGRRKLTGRVIGTEGSWGDNPGTTRAAAFDGDALTYFDARQSDEAWTGLDLGVKRAVGKIRFIARNDLNSIQKGDEYELFYWDNAWVSLGKKVAATYELNYDNAPVNALFWLRNLTAGREERIFTYEEGKQIWW